jgi:hypothetical protein
MTLSADERGAFLDAREESDLVREPWRTDDGRLVRGDGLSYLERAELEAPQVSDRTRIGCALEYLEAIEDDAVAGVVAQEVDRLREVLAKIDGGEL